MKDLQFNTFLNSGHPEYKIRYRQCNEKNHDCQMLNIICVQIGCKDNSLICSLCREDKHKNHKTKPLKFYLQQLKNQFESNERDYQLELNQLQSSRNIFLNKLQQIVIQIAQQFRMVEQEVLDRYELIRNQILQNLARKNQFKDFYKSLTSHSDQQPQFLMSNYLPRKQLSLISNLDSLNKTSIMICNEIINVKQQLLKTSQNIHIIDHLPKYIPPADLYLLPTNILKEGYIFTQNSANDLNAQSLVLLNIPLENLHDKIKLKLITFRKNAKITCGAINKQYFQSLNHKWIFDKNDKVMWISSDGQQYNCNIPYINGLNEGSQLEISYTTNILKLSTKKISTTMTINNPKQFYFFFSIKGKAKLQVVYPFK